MSDYEYYAPEDNKERSKTSLTVVNVEDGSDSAEEKEQKQGGIPNCNQEVISAAGPEKEFKVKDIPALVIFALILLGFLGIGIYSLAKGDPIKYLKGYDSWGNVCGRMENTPIPGVDFSGRDLSANKYAFHVGLTEYENAVNPIKYYSMKKRSAVICVKECPTTMTNCDELARESGYINISQEYVDNFICTSSPGILAHRPILNRCIPSQILQVRKLISVSVED